MPQTLHAKEKLLNNIKMRKKQTKKCIISEKNPKKIEKSPLRKSILVVGGGSNRLVGGVEVFSLVFLRYTIIIREETLYSYSL